MKESTIYVTVIGKEKCFDMVSTICIFTKINIKFRENDSKVHRSLTFVDDEVVLIQLDYGLQRMLMKLKGRNEIGRKVLKSAEG